MSEDDYRDHWVDIGLRALRTGFKFQHGCLPIGVVGGRMVPDLLDPATFGIFRDWVMSTLDDPDVYGGYLLETEMLPDGENVRWVFCSHNGHIGSGASIAEAMLDAAEREVEKWRG